VICLTACTKANKLESAICLSFDDNYLESWIDILPLLERYNARVTFFITGAGKLNEQEKAWLKQIQEAGHEIGAHGEIHTSANSYIEDHGYLAYWEYEIQANVAALEALGISPRVFAYPFGEKNRLMDILLWGKFNATRNVLEINASHEIQQKDALKSHPSFHYYSISIDAGELESLEQLGPFMQVAKQEEKVLFLHAHDIRDSGGYTVTKQRLDSLLQLGEYLGLKFISFSEL
jgi:peptidoglycan/xylan/chitin deacetylase (PgdA/CDA1 family)